MFVPDYNIGDYEVLVDDKNLVSLVIYLPTGRTMKRFTGESAWADARRHANDKYFAMGGK